MKTRKTAVVLGCGMVGATMARDLARGPNLQVIAADASAERLRALGQRRDLSPREADLSDPSTIGKLAAEADVVVGALPSKLGLGALRAVIEAGKPYCDISFMSEDATELNELARARGVTAVVDCGVAPGLANMIIGHCHAQLDQTDDVTFYVGGLPRERRWPYEYKAPFAPLDVIEEYTRPARKIENGKVVEREALSETELIDFPGVGTLEAFNTDGLRSLLTTVRARNMSEKTLRYPGHAELMRILRQTGFFDNKPLDINGHAVAPLDVTTRLLFPHWKLQPGEEEFTLLDVRVRGRKRGEERAFHYTLLDTYHGETDEHSMSRTTGYPCTIVARMLLDGTFASPGVHAPETLGAQPDVLQRVIDELAERYVMVHQEEPTATARATAKG